jgi:hypothetical protein
MKLKITALFIILLGLSLPAYPKSHGHRFVTPPKSVCLRYGGLWTPLQVCEAHWSKAKKICRAIGGRLPSLRTFAKAIRVCGGHISERSNPKLGDSISYTTCIRNLGIPDIGYNDFWTSTSAPSPDFKMLVSVNSGYYSDYLPRSHYFVTCIR